MVEVTDQATSFSRGDAVRVVEGQSRAGDAAVSVRPPGGCGGCDLQHASLAAQRSWKSALVSEHLKRIAGVERDVTLIDPGVDSKASRTRLRCAVNEEGQLSLRAVRSHDLIAIDHCWIANASFAPAFATSWDGAQEVELRGIGAGEPFAVVRRDTDRGTLYELCSLRGEPLEPSTQSRVDVNGHVFSVGPRSFWQSHRAAPGLLLDTVLSFAEIKEGEHVADLFSGVGLFAVPISKAVGPGGRVTAVESSPHAVRDARQNAEGFRNVKVREWSVSPRSVNDSVGERDLVVVDPPRGGLAKGVPEALIRRRPRRIIYVSCDAATFARDLKALRVGGYEIG